MYKDINAGLASFIKKSPTAFQAVASMEEILRSHGFVRLQEEQRWDVKPGGKYYVTRNGSSIIALDLGTDLGQYSFNIAASHSDSPAFKLKEKAELAVRGKYMQLNVEGYGAMPCAPWMDRPLSIAGRVVLKDGGSFITRLVHMDRDLVLIPSVAIHMNRGINESASYNKQIDMLPLFGGSTCTPGAFRELLAAELQVEEKSIYGMELFLYNRMEPAIWGAEQEFISAPRLDDLQSAYASLQGFLQGENSRSVNVFACFDNEEVGSHTKQGAGSTFLYDVLHRCSLGLGKSEEEYYRALASSFMLSCDNAHAVHPNHPEKTDAENCVFLNEGIVIKSHAGQKYTSDAISVALFRGICEDAEVPVQYFANRSDAVGGSTLGNIAMSQVSVNTIDIGLPQLAMHSPYETAGVRDTAWMARAVRRFFRTYIQVKDGRVQLM